MTVRTSLLITLSTLLTFSKVQAQFFYESSIGKPLQAGQLRAPSDVAIDGSGNIFVADRSGQIVKFNVGGTQLLSFGTRGQGNGQFNYPNCIALDQSGNIYVADTNNSTVLKFNSSGDFQSNLATPGSGNGQIIGPHGIDIDANGNIFVSETGRQKILKFSSLGTLIREFGSQGTGNGQFNYANAVATDASGNVYVLDTSFPRVQKFSKDGDYISQWGSTGGNDGQFGWPLGMATDASGNVYVSEYFSHRIQKFDINRVFTSKFGSFGSNNNEFYFPKGMAIDAAGNIYVADESNSRVQKFNSSFSYQSTVGIPLGDGQLYNPSGVTTDAAGNIYVADTFNDQIQKFSSTGTFLTRWGGFGNTNGKFNSPYDMAIDAVGNVYVVDGGCSVQKFSSTGTFMQKWAGTYGPGDNQLSDPRGIAIDASNNVYVVDKNNHRIVKYSSSGTFITKWGQVGIGPGDLNYPNGIAIDASGNIYVCDTENDRILKFTNSGVPLGQWSTTSTGNAQFDNPVAICISPSGKVFITDSNRIQIFDSNGQFLGKYNSYSFGGAGFLGPIGIETNSAGALYLADVSNHRINKYSVLDLLSLSANNGVVGTSITISGTGFSTVASENIVKFNNTTAEVSSSISPTSLTVTVPSGATTGKVSVTRGGYTVQSVNEFLVLPLAITSFTPSVGSLGASITITGTGFSSVKENNKVKFNGIAAIVTESAATSLTATVPAGNTIGKISVTVNGITVTSTTNFEGTLAINSFSPANGLAGASITLTGSGFSSTSSNQVVKFNGIVADITASSLNSLTVRVPVGATTGKISVAREGSTVLSANEFLVLPLAVTSFTPAAGIVGTPVTINGTGFSSVNGNNSVTFNGVTAVPASTSTSITTKVPAGATTGKISITVAGQAATSVSDFIVTRLGISQTSYPEFFIVDESGANVAILVNDINEIQSIKINRRGITEEDSKLKVDAIPFTTSGNTVSLSVPASYFTDPLGLYCWFSVTEKAGNEILSQPGNIYLKYLASSNKQVIPDLTAGKKTSAYQLIAIPLELTTKSTKDVFADLGSYDNKKWRLYSITNEKLGENPLTIETGKGYWFIMRDQTELNPGQGTVVKVTKQTPYKMSLSSGWNLIGNPYNFNISWDDVLDHNGLPEEKLKFRQFINGGFVNEPLLKLYRGGFVESDVAREIEIPVINKSATGGRKATTQTQPIDKPEWMVNLTLQDDEFSNSLFGFGMNPQASVEKDLWDETALPLLEGLSPFEMSFGKHLVKDVVPTMENYSWQAELSASKNILLRWDNSYFGNNEKQLIIENSNEVETINMRSANQLKLLEGNHLLKFHYGNADYIKDQLMESSARIGNVFPNPIKKVNGLVSVSVSLPDGDNEVSLRLKNLLGQEINYSGPGHYEGGRRNIQWQSDFNQVPSGMYLMQIEVKDSKGVTSRITRRIIFE